MRTKYGLAAVAALLSAGVANAGLYTDDAARCLVAKTSDADKAALIRWMFAAISANPAVKDLASVDDAVRARETSATAAMANRLILVDCRAQFIAALKNEGASVFPASFEVLGRAAMVGLMNHPSVAQQLETLGSGMDGARLKELAREAGVATKDAPAAPTKK